MRLRMMLLGCGLIILVAGCTGNRKTPADRDAPAPSGAETRDGGADMFLVDKETNGINVVVEVKRYAKTRSVGIGAVQRLAGVALDFGAAKARLVTTSQISRDGQLSAERINSHGIVEVDFVTASDLMALLSVYNTRMPLLQDLTGEVRVEIIRENRGDA